MDPIFFSQLFQKIEFARIISRMSLLEKQFLFTQLVARFVWELRDLGYHVTLGEAYRTPEQAAMNAAKGTGIAMSLHVQRLAIDLNLFRDEVFLQSLQDYEPAGKLWESYSTKDYECAWGGRFKTLPDADHFSISYEGRR